MIKTKTIALLVYVLLLSTLGACGTPTTGLPTNGQIVSSPANQATPTKASSSSTASTAARVVVGNAKTHEDSADYTWDSSKASRITLQGNSITPSGTGVTVVGSKATITSPGTFILSGSLTDGQIIVNSTIKGTVKVVLDGVDLRNTTSAPIYVMNADKTVIILADNSRNTVSDGKSYVQAANEDEPNAAIFSKSDLTIYGNGSLTVEGNYNDGIASKDGLILASGTITVKAVDDGIRGKDYVIVNNGNITVTAQGDGLKSDNAEDATRGYVSIKNGTFKITSGKDTIQAHTSVTIADGKFNLAAGGGSTGKIAADASAKGIKAITSVKIDGGTFTIDSADDAVHSNDSLLVNAGTFTITTGDDALHADKTLMVNGGNITIIKSYEGIESENITINNGEIHIVASDDGLNAAGGVDGSGMIPGPGFARGPGGRMQGGFAASGNYHVYINGGYIAITAGGDGLDINGSIEMTNGVVIVNGPTANSNGALDYDAGFKLTGGFVVAVGSSGMAQAPDNTSTQYSLLANLSATQRAGTMVHIQSADGKDILTFVPTKDYQSIAFTSPLLTKGSTYDIYLGGSSTGTVKDGLYQNGTYTSGIKNSSFTISSIVTSIGSASRFMR
ncbi:MAG: carbohydrate-binding domain-containing protein [Chloroflexi bacterium]|nr:carbohydrate-binding domain-containing protein [Chloroflexota bacterium]